MKKIYEIRYLSKSFYETYSNELYPELECKESRPFLVLLIDINNLKFAIPFRSNITHKYCYKFENSGRSTETSTALDFSKSIIVKKEVYIDSYAFIDNDEYIELNSKIYFIISKFKKFLELYIKIREKYPKDSYKYKMMSFCTLQYFYDELIESYKCKIN